MEDLCAHVDEDGNRAEQQMKSWLLYRVFGKRLVSLARFGETCF